MNLTDLVPSNVRGFAEEITKLEIREIEVPKFYLPNWPKAAGEVVIKLGKKDYVYPEKADQTGMLRLVNKRHQLQFTISSTSTRIDFGGFRHPVWSGSHEDQNFERIKALIMFHQFKDELFARIMQQLRHDLGFHNQVADMVRQAFEPFIPFVVLDQLTS